MVKECKDLGMSFDENVEKVGDHVEHILRKT